LLKKRVMREGDAAHGVHQLVLVHGHEQARQMVPEKQRPLVDIAAEVMADERQNIGISYTGFCLTSLPGYQTTRRGRSMGTESHCLSSPAA